MAVTNVVCLLSAISQLVLWSSVDVAAAQPAEENLKIQVIDWPEDTTVMVEEHVTFSVTFELSREPIYHPILEWLIEWDDTKPFYQYVSATKNTSKIEEPDFAGRGIYKTHYIMSDKHNNSVKHTCSLSISHITLTDQGRFSVTYRMPVKNSRHLPMSRFKLTVVPSAAYRVPNNTLIFAVIGTVVGVLLLIIIVLLVKKQSHGKCYQQPQQQQPQQQQQQQQQPRPRLGTTFDAVDLSSRVCETEYVGPLLNIHPHTTCTTTTLPPSASPDYMDEREGGGGCTTLDAVDPKCTSSRVCETAEYLVPIPSLNQLNIHSRTTTTTLPPASPDDIICHDYMDVNNWKEEADHMYIHPRTTTATPPESPDYINVEHINGKEGNYMDLIL